MTSIQGHAIEHLPFRPLRGFTSPHLQTIFSTLLRKPGIEPPTASMFISLKDGDTLHCMRSIPSSWKASQKTILFIHGLGGSHASSYMVRMSRKFFNKGFQTVRINLRGTGPGAHLAQRPYHAGTSEDLLEVIKALKKEAPDSPLILIGYSLGGNIALKLLGELEEKAKSLIEQTIAVCAPVDLAYTTRILLNRSNHFYHQYYIKGLKSLGKRWIGEQPIHSLIDFDHVVTAPQWGYKDAFDYYRQCSSCYYLPRIQQTCHMIFAADDPFICHHIALKEQLLPSTKVWISKYGGHMGFWGWSGHEHGYCWLDHFIFSLILKN